MMCNGVQLNPTLCPNAPLQHDGKPRPASWQTEAYDAHLAARHPDDKVLAATARNPAPSRIAFNAKESAQDEKEYAFDKGLCAALFSDDSDPNCLSAVKNEIEYCYRHSPTFRRSVNYHFATAPQEKIRLRPDVRYTTTVTEPQIQRAGRREMTIVLDHDHDGALQNVDEDADECISGPRALTHEMLHFLNEMCDDNDAKNLLGGIVEFNNIVRAEAYGEPARAQYGPYERIDDGRPEGVGGKYFNEYMRIQDQVRGGQANGETPHWASHRLATLRAQIERDGETAEMIEAQARNGAQNAECAVWTKRQKDVEDENSKDMERHYEEQARAQRKRRHTTTSTGADYLAANAASFAPFLGADESAPQAPQLSEEAAWNGTLNVVRAEAMQALSRLSPVDLAALTEDSCYVDPTRPGASPKDFEAVSNMLAQMCMTRGKEAAPELKAVRNRFIAGTLDYAGNGRRNSAADNANESKYKNDVQGWKSIKPGVRKACILFIRKYQKFNEAIAPVESKQQKKTQNYNAIKEYHVNLWNGMAPELRKAIGGVTEFCKRFGFSVYTMNSRLCVSHGTPLAGVRAYTGNTASYRLLMQKWVEMSAWERRMINGLRGFATKNGLNYKNLRSDILRFQAEATERRQAKPAPPAQAGSGVLRAEEPAVLR